MNKTQTGKRASQATRHMTLGSLCAAETPGGVNPEGRSPGEEAAVGVREAARRSKAFETESECLTIFTEWQTLPCCPYDTVKPQQYQTPCKYPQLLKKNSSLAHTA